MNAKAANTQIASKIYVQGEKNPFYGNFSAPPVHSLQASSLLEYNSTK